MHPVSYRWHATLSEMDVKWAEDIIAKALNRRDFENVCLSPRTLNSLLNYHQQLTVEDYLRAYQQMDQPHKDPKVSTPSGAQRLGTCLTYVSKAPGIRWS